MRFAPKHPARELIRNEVSPMAAKMIAKAHKDDMTVKPMSDADLVNMRIVLETKLHQHAHLIEALVETGDAILVEDVAARKNLSGLFWGAYVTSEGTLCGANKLGKLWMELRAQHRPSPYVNCTQPSPRK